MKPVVDSAHALRRPLDSGLTGPERVVVTNAASPRRWARCCQCGTSTNRPVNVGVVETGSGPGVLLYGCLRCASSLARRDGAPEWLKDKFRGRLARLRYRLWGRIA